MSTATLVSVDEFLRITEKPHREYREGIVTVKAKPTKFHSLVMLALANLLQQQGVKAYPELTLRLSPTKFLVPDITVAEDFPGDYPTEPVFLCCEILSPDDRLGAMLGKCEDFHAWGVPYCWVIDPVKRTAWEYHSGSDPLKVDAALTAGKLSVPLPAAFATLP